jgi:hypothetical protein
MTWNGIVAISSAWRTVPRLGVRPPSSRLAQSSTRSAPACCAATSPSIPSTQISMIGWVMRPMLAASAPVRKPDSTARTLYGSAGSRRRPMPLIDDDRLFDAEPRTRDIARALYSRHQGPAARQPARPHRSPLVCENEPFPDPARLLIVPDHYIFRMLFSQGVRLEDLGVPDADGSAGRDRRPQDLAAVRRELPPVPRHADAHVVRPHAVGRCSASTERCRPNGGRALRPHRRATADRRLSAARPVRALQHRGHLHDRRALDDLKWHKMIRASGWKGRVVPPIGRTVVDPDFDRLPAEPR